MTIRFQRLLIIFLSMVFLTAAILLILFNSKKNLVFFYTPTEFFNSNIEINEIVRIGGFVQKDSIKIEKNNKYEFVITDNNEFIFIFYEGLLPDLFRENQGIVIEGIIIENNRINASTVFAKHDENYMPTSIKNQLKKK